jgi:hypothetical protein
MPTAKPPSMTLPRQAGNISRRGRPGGRPPSRPPDHAARSRCEDVGPLCASRHVRERQWHRGERAGVLPVHEAFGATTNIRAASVAVRAGLEPALASCASYSDRSSACRRSLRGTGSASRRPGATRRSGDPVASGASAPYGHACGWRAWTLPIALSQTAWRPMAKLGYATC